MVDDRPRSQQIMWRVQRIGWGVLAAILAAACGGLFGGGGPLAERTLHEGERGFAITHDRVVRQSRPTVWSIALPADTSTLVLRDPATELFELLRIVPRPVVERWVNGAVVMEFQRADAAPMRVQLVLAPATPGRHAVEVGTGAWMTTFSVITLP